MLEAAHHHLREGRVDQAEQIATQLLRAQPEHCEALYILGLIRWRRGDGPGAIAQIERILTLPEAGAAWHSDLAEMCRVEGRLDDALRHGLRGIALSPDSANAHYNLGVIHFDRGEMSEAITCDRRAIALKPDHADAHFELGEALLLTGDLREGWEEYEWRFKVAGATPLIPPAQAAKGKYWNGEPLHDKTLLVIADQGFGDVIQFMRYLPDLVPRCGDLVVACGVEMKPLIAHMLAKSAKKVRMFQLWDEAPTFDYYMALSSLPRLFGTEPHSIPNKTPYLRAEPQRRDQWERRLKGLVPSEHRRIGLVWSGRTSPNATPHRAMTLDDLAPLATLSGVTLVSLQKSEASAQISTYYGAAPLINLAPEIKDFQDTAAIIENLDLVVTIDTSVAHLVGALGRPAAVLLKFAADWRWLQQRTDSPWYPSLRLYRQPRPRDWSAVIANLMQDLRKNPGLLRQRSEFKNSN
jgi:Flp pilus assembly protein TadD